jgi:hypothetical protein
MREQVSVIRLYVINSLGKATARQDKKSQRLVKPNFVLLPMHFSNQLFWINNNTTNVFSVLAVKMYSASKTRCAWGSATAPSRACLTRTA